MRVADFDFDLPPALIAQHPPADRGTSRLLLLERATGRIHHLLFSDLPAWLRDGDVVVVNNTRVFPARLVGTRLPGGGRAQCLLLRQTGVDVWEALVHPGQRLREGARMIFEGGHSRLLADVVALHHHGRRTIRLWNDEGRDTLAVIEEIGHIPLPPYIRRPDTSNDRERYQTMFARVPGSIAAPTAGLHFTPEMFRTLWAGGVRTACVTLHVGYGTFRPVRVENVDEHRVDAEPFELSVEDAEIIACALREGRRVIAVGTTTTRALEAAAVANGVGVNAGAAETDLFIRPGHVFKVVGGLLTNFHLPRSSLLMLVSAFGGRERVLDAYRAAVRESYRFYSYGDAMLVI